MYEDNSLHLCWEAVRFKRRPTSGGTGEARARAHAVPVELGRHLGRRRRRRRKAAVNRVLAAAPPPPTAQMRRSVCIPDLCFCTLRWYTYRIPDYFSFRSPEDETV